MLLDFFCSELPFTAAFGLTFLTAFLFGGCSLTGFRLSWSYVLEFFLSGLLDIWEEGCCWEALLCEPTVGTFWKYSIVRSDSVGAAPSTSMNLLKEAGPSMFWLWSFLFEMGVIRIWSLSTDPDMLNLFVFTWTVAGLSVSYYCACSEINMACLLPAVEIVFPVEFCILKFRSEPP